MLVCHERYFLDALCDSIFELERGKGRFYKGNYSAYETQKEHNLALLESAYNLQQKEIKQKQETINRFKASASRAKQAQSMIKQLISLSALRCRHQAKPFAFNFLHCSVQVKQCLRLPMLAYTFGQHPLFEHISFEVERGQKVALVASNGGGKSTLLHLISGKLPLQQGLITFGTQVQVALFDQDQNAALDPQKTILENIDGHCAPGVTTALVRSFLGGFLFSGTDVNKKVGVLSGGEKNRVGMVKVLLQHANLLLLDEPTNHLDIASKKILLEALRAYEGTIVFVSHDRAFLNDLATRVIELTPTGIISFEGNYDQFLYYKKQIKQEPLPLPSTTMPKHTTHKNTYEQAKKIKSLERKIDQLEQKIKQQEELFAQLSFGTAAYTDARQHLNTLKEQYEQAMKEWEGLQQVN